jgi:hypothetical protein
MYLSNEYAMNQRRKDLMREAQNERLALQAQDSQKLYPVYAPVLAAVGRQLVQLGERLQGE